MDPAGKTSRAQASIRSFFQPRSQPKYAAPPSLPTTAAAQPAPSQPAVTVTTTSTTTITTSTTPPTAPIPPTVQAGPTKPTAQDAAAALASLPVLPPPPSLPRQATIGPVLEHHISALRRINSLLLPVTYPDAFYTRILAPEVSGLFSRIILWQDDSESEPKVVGGIVCRLEPSPFVDASGGAQNLAAHRRTIPAPNGAGGADQPPRSGAVSHHAIYIQSLALLSPYRSHGLAAAALENIAGSAALLRRMPAASPGQPPTLDVGTIYAHVWTENDEGLRWYAARGFAREGSEPVHGYYFKLRPDSAWVVRREIEGGGPVVGATPEGSVSAGLLDARTKSATSASSPQVASPASTVAAAVNLVAANNKLVEAQQAAARPTQVPTPPTATPSPAPSMSYQKAGPGAEWNDLPAEMVASALLAPGGRSTHLSAPGSGASSSRSSSTGRKKKERSYPAAAFGS